MNVSNGGERESGFQQRRIDLGQVRTGGERFSLNRWFHALPIWDFDIGGVSLGVVFNRLLPTEGTQHVRLEPKSGSGRMGPVSE